MRRQLIAVFAAVALLIVVPFVVPFGVVMQRTIRANAIDQARASVTAVEPVVRAGSSPELIRASLLSTDLAESDRISVLLSDGTLIGLPILPTVVTAARQRGGNTQWENPDGSISLTAVVDVPDGGPSLIRATIPRSALTRNRTVVWTALLGVGLALIGIAILVADQLARSIVRPTEKLAEAARAIGAGDLAMQVQPDGPDELRDLASAMNNLGTQVNGMIEHERGFIAKLSHELRTPLTKLRLGIDSLESPAEATVLRSDVDEVTRKLTSVIDDIRGELDNRDRDRRSSDARAVLARRAAFWEVLADEQGRPWINQVDDEPLLAGIVEREIETMVDIAFDNIFSHTESQCAVAFGTDVTNGRPRLWFADAGPGLDPNAIRPGNSASSSGLGLSIARETLDGAGGELQLATSSLGGAFVGFVFPPPQNMATAASRPGARRAE